MTDDLTRNDGEALAETVDVSLTGETGREALVGQAAGAIDVSAPGAGEVVNISLVKGQTATLNFDATAATPIVEGNDFVLTFDSNGDGEADSRIVFLNLVEESQGGDAPILVIGGVELSAALLIGQAQALIEGETLETAAGAGAGPAGGGGSVYSDDFGNSIGLLNAQGVIDPTELEFGLIGGTDDITDLAEGSLTVTFLTTVTDVSESEIGGISGTFAGGFEDWLPNQHLSAGDQGNDSSPFEVESRTPSDLEFFAAPMQVIFTFVPSDNETLDSVTIDGIPDGAKLYIGGSDSGDEYTGGFPVTIDDADFDAVYLLPPKNSDADITLTGTGAITDPDSGDTATLTFTATAIIDAVADLPTDLTTGEGGEVSLGEEELVEIPVSVQFGDFADDSETHELVLDNVPADWDIKGIPGATIWMIDGDTIYKLEFDAFGNVEKPLEAVDPSDTANLPAATSFEIQGGGTDEPLDAEVGDDEFVRYVIDVSENIDGTDGEFDGDIVFNPNDWTNSRSANGELLSKSDGGGVTIEVRAVATETELSGDELTDPDGTPVDENNQAVTGPQYFYVSINEDIPTVTLLSIELDETDGLQTTAEQNVTASENVTDVANAGTRIDLALTDDGLDVDRTDAISKGFSSIDDAVNLFTDGNNDELDGSDVSSDPTDTPLDDASDPTTSHPDDLESIQFIAYDGTVDSGLETTDGKTIYLYTSASNTAVVYGIYLDDVEVRALDVGDGQTQQFNLSDYEVAFIATIDSALHNDENSVEIYVEQFESLHHGVAGENDPSGNPNPHNEIADLDLQYFVTDDEGDPSGNGTLTIDFRDDGPTADLSANQGAEIRLDETVDGDDDNGGGDGILAQNTIGASVLFTDNSDFGSDEEASDPAVARVFSLTLTNPDGPGSTDPILSGLTDTLTGQSIILTQAVLGGDIVGSTATDGDEVFSISINTETGAVTVTQIRAIEHDEANDPDENVLPEIMESGLITATLTVTDGDGDSDSNDAELGSLIKFEDDGPTADLSANQGAEIRLDETVDGDDDNGGGDGILAQNTIGASVLFTDNSDFGSDEEASDPAVARVFSLTLTNPDGPGSTDPILSGLTDTLTGQSIILTQAVLGGDIVGSTATDGDEVFSISINTETGAVTVTQIRAIEHDEANDPDENVLPEIMESGLITATLTVTDGDGDSDSNDAELGSLIKFEDDGPTADLSANQGAEIRLDETVDGDDDNGGGDGILAQNTIGASVLFTDNSDFGSDEEASDPAVARVFSLTLTNPDGPGSTDPILSGLTDTLTGQSIILTQAVLGGDIVGSTATDGDEVFSISINTETGAVTVTQIRAIEHDEANDPDENVLPEIMESGLITATLTVTDGDGDSDSNDAELGSLIKFEDDGPSLTSTSVTDLVHEDALPLANDDNVQELEATGSVAALFSVGSDGPGTYSMLTNVAALDALQLTSNGALLTYTVENGLLTATAEDPDFTVRDIFTLELEADGDYTFTLIDQIDHADGGNDDGQLLDIDFGSLIRLTDGDGDYVNATGNFVISIQDDIPVNNGVAAEIYAVNEDSLSTEGAPFDLSEGNTDDSALTEFTTILNDDLAGKVSIGADAPARFELNAALDGTVALMTAGDTPVAVTSNGETVYLLFVDGNPDVIQGIAGTGGSERVVFVIKKSFDGKGFDFDLDDQIDHVDDLTNNDGQFINLDISSVFEAFDADGDSVVLSTAVTIAVEDDIPEAISDASVTGLVHEDALDAGNKEPGSNPAQTLTASGSVVDLFSIGADEVGTYSLVDALTDGLPALTSNGLDITYEVVGETLTASTNDGPVFTLTLDASGNYTFTLLAAIDHADGGNIDSQLETIDFSALVRLTDKDGDFVNATGTFEISIEDDLPIITALPAAADSLQVDESDLALDKVTDFSGKFTVLEGADGGTVTYALSVSSDGVYSGVTDTASQQAVLLTDNGSGVIEGRTETGDVLVFTVSVDADGKVTLNQLRAVDHGDDSNNPDSEISLLAGVVSLTATLTDGDLDTDSDSIDLSAAISFRDDGPVAEDDVDSVNENASTTGNVVTGVGDGGLVADTEGADGASITSVVAVPGTNVTDITGSLDTDDLVLITDNGQLAINSDGSYTYTANAGYEGAQQDQFTYILTDGDGDWDPAILTINLVDSIQSPTVIGDTDLVVEDLLDDGSGNDPDSGAASTIAFDTLIITNGLVSALSYSGGPLGAATAMVGTMGWTADDGSWTMTITEAGYYEFELLNPMTHSDGTQVFSADQITGSFGVTVSGIGGPDATATITISVNDDGPTAVNDGTLNIGAALEDNVVDANVGTVDELLLNDNFGADGEHASNRFSIDAPGTLGGTITIDEFDNLLYTASPGAASVEDVTETFTYTITDADGDTTTATFDIDLTAAVVEFPSGLAYTVLAGASTTSGRFLYAVDLETGVTEQIGQLTIDDGSPLDYNINGLTLSPDDGFLYGFGGKGSLHYLIRVDPTTGEAISLDDGRIYSGTGGLSFTTGGTLWAALDNSVGIVTLDSGPPLSASYLETFDVPSSQKIDAFVISPDGLTVYYQAGDDLYSVDVDPTSPTYLDTIHLGLMVYLNESGAYTTVTLNGMSFDDSGQLWGADNAGKILSINPTTDPVTDNVIGVLVSTISNSEVRGNGLASLAISIKEPGTYVRILEGAEEKTAFLADVTSVPVDTVVDMDGGDDISFDRAADGSITVIPDNGVTLDSIYLQNDDDVTATISKFQNVDVRVSGGDETSMITINDLESGDIRVGVLFTGTENMQIGDSDDIVTVTAADANGGNSSIMILTGDGDDIITLVGGFDDETLYTIDGGFDDDGEGGDYDILVLNNGANLANADISNIEAIDLTGYGTDSFILDVTDVIDWTDTDNTLVIEGLAGNSITITGQAIVVPTNDAGYDTYVLANLSVILIDEDISVSFV